MMSESILRLAGFAYGGEALGRLEDGRMVFVPFALPGETVRVRLVEEKRGYARAQLVEVLQSSPERIQPRCVHFSLCGGCHYQHLSYSSQLAAKSAILREQLERIGGIVDPVLGEMVASPQPFNYRNHMQFHLSAEGRLGFRLSRSEEVLAIQECHLPETVLSQVWPLLDFETLPGLERISLRLGAADDVQLVLESSDPAPPEINVEDLPLSVVHLSQGDALVLAGSPAVAMEVLGRSFSVSAGSFFQVNTPMAEEMVKCVLHLLDQHQALGPNKTLIDVYCGVGLFSAFIAPRVRRLIAIEASPSAAEDFTLNLDEFDQVELYEAPAEVALPAMEVQPAAVLVDPPREGLDRRALDALIRMHPPLLIYVSCDPSTLARDAKRLVAAGYRLEQVTPFDLFPQTYHIESISCWTRG
jgi:23S rRNA (uracil1939-C5)-methyltransferase